MTDEKDHGAELAAAPPIPDVAATETASDVPVVAIYHAILLALSGPRVEKNAWMLLEVLAKQLESGEWAILDRENREDAISLGIFVGRQIGSDKLRFDALQTCREFIEAHEALALPLAGNQPATSGIASPAASFALNAHSQPDPLSLPETPPRLDKNVLRAPTNRAGE